MYVNMPGPSPIIEQKPGQVANNETIVHTNKALVKIRS